MGILTPTRDGDRGHAGDGGGRLGPPGAARAGRRASAPPPPYCRSPPASGCRGAPGRSRALGTHCPGCWGGSDGVGLSVGSSGARYPGAAAGGSLTLSRACGACRPCVCPHCEPSCGAHPGPQAPHCRPRTLPLLRAACPVPLPAPVEPCPVPASPPALWCPWTVSVPPAHLLRHPQILSFSLLALFQAGSSCL